MRMIISLTSLFHSHSHRLSPHSPNRISLTHHQLKAHSPIDDNSLTHHDLAMSNTTQLTTIPKTP